jgi:hypothetical protein
VSDCAYRSEIDLFALETLFCLSLTAFTAICVYNEGGFEIPRQPALRSLCFRESCFDKEGIAMTLQACPALQSFTYERPLPSIQFYKNTSVNRIVQHFNITDATIALKSYQGCLEELSLQFPRGDTHSGTIKDSSQFSSLKRLSVDQCNFKSSST